MNRYILAFASSVLSVVAMLILMGLFSNIWPAKSFLQFAADIRTAGFLISLGSFSLGFAIISRAKELALKRVIYPVAFWSVAALSGFISVVWVIGFGGSLSVSTWVVAGAIFHVYVSSLRVDGTGYASLVTILCKFGFVILCSIVTLSLDEKAEFYFCLYGGSLIAWVIYDSWRTGFSFLGSGFGSTVALLYSDNWTRALDNIVRASFHILPVWIVAYHLGSEASGLMALALLLVKALESGLQPVVMQIHMTRNKRGPCISSRMVASVFITAILLTGLLYLGLVALGDLVIVLWLGEVYKPVLSIASISIWALPAIISMQLYKGFFESATRSSPFLGFNIFSLLVMAVLGLYFNMLPSEVAMLYVIFNFSRMASLVPLRRKGVIS